MTMTASQEELGRVHARNAAKYALHKEHPLAAVCYSRWKHMDRDDVMVEMAILFHLAVQIDDVKAIESHDRPL